MDTSIEQDLILRAKKGEKEAFESLLRPLISPAGRLAYGMLQDRTEAEDVLQEAAIKAWRRINNLHTAMHFAPWFFGIVANQCRDVKRSRWWSVRRLAATPSGDQAGPEPIAVRNVELQRAIRDLPHDERAAILLHFGLDWSIQDVSRALGISAAGTKSRINRAIKRMRPTLKSTEVLV